MSLLALAQPLTPQSSGSPASGASVASASIGSTLARCLMQITTPSDGARHSCSTSPNMSVTTPMRSPGETLEYRSTELWKSPPTGVTLFACRLPLAGVSERTRMLSLRPAVYSDACETQ